jgi:hypothetical protein
MWLIKIDNFDWSEREFVGEPWQKVKHTMMMHKKQFNLGEKIICTYPIANGIGL